ncbi:MAG: carboxypeptidase regulatory-like domain-containing protein, partial [Acidobacteriota bacterium]
MLSLLTVMVGLAEASALAQQTGSISGVVRDETGAVLPGVTITVAGEALFSPRLQETGSRGGYSFPGIPVGSYAVLFELSGFASQRRKGVIVEAARNVTLDAVLRVAFEQEVMVESSTLIDRKNSRVGENVDNDFLQDVPNGRDVWVVLEETPGVLLDKFNVGGSESGQQSLFSAAGTAWTQNSYNLNGVNTTDPSALGASSTYYSYDSFEEIQVSTAGHPAEVQSPGVFLNLVLKGGGNRLRGGGALYFENDALQSENLDDRLRASGLGTTNRLDRYHDYSLELGGPIVRDRAWFYAHLSEQQIEPFVIGFFLPGGRPGIDLTELKNRILRASVQLKTRHRLGGLYFQDTKFKPHRGAGRNRPTPATTLYQDSTTKIAQALYTGILNANTLLDARFSLMDMFFPLGEQPDLPPGDFSRIELVNGVRSGGPGRNRLFERRRWQGYASLAYYRDNWLGGSHDFKLGWEHSYSPVRTTDGLKGSILYQDLFASPVQVELYSDPVTTKNHTRNTSFFAQDSFVTGAWVLNLGLRFDRWTAGYPDQARSPGPWEAFFSARGLSTSTPARSGIVSWNGFAPRLGLIYVLTADGKTVLRGNFSRYYHQVSTDLASFANPNGRAAALFSFNDDNGNRLLEVGEVDFAAPLAVNIPAANEVDGTIRQPLTDELTVGLER